MGLTPNQIICTQEWNKLIATKAETALGSVLGGKFTAANYSAGFNYQVKSTTYNSQSLKTLDTLVELKDGVSFLTTGYSSFYKSVMEKVHFNISKEDRQRVNQEANAQEALVASIINSYNQSEIDETPMNDPTVPKIMNRIKQFTGSSYRDLNLREYPYLSNLCNLLREFERKAEFTTKIMKASSNAEDRLEAIIKHIANPDNDNGGLKTENGFVCGWNNIKEPVQLLESLEGGKSITIEVSASNFYEKSSHLNFKNDVHVDVPVNWFFNLKADHHDEYDLSKYVKNGAEMSISVKYDGVTLLPVNPMGLTDDNEKGWYLKNILEQVAAKSGKDVTGYQLVDSEFDPKTLFGEEGKLRRMRTLVISQQPIVKLHFKKFDCNKLKKQFDETTNAEFKLFGGIISGNHENSYNMSECKIDESSDSLDVTFMPEPLGSSGTAANQTAYVLGGVVDYIKNDVEVKKVRIIEDEVGAAEDDVTLSDELKNLKLLYRKNNDGKYELAGLYDEKEDVEDMLGDNVAVPITSRLAENPVKILYAGTEVYNVEGSTGDPYNGNTCRSWIQLWENVLKNKKIVGQEWKCYVCGVKYIKEKNNLVGAHVVTDPKKVINPKEDDIIYIVPLCKGDNNKSSAVAMKLIDDVPAMCLYRFQK